MQSVLMLSAFADAPVAPNPLMQFLPLVLVFGIFYFLLIAPMRKRQKAHQQMLSELKKGDKVVTNGGLYGEIHALDESTVILRVADDVKVRVARHAVSGMEGQEEAK
ncbi:MAG: preprotein translocase subunit YajC [Thermoanaerobaculia bacterium]